MVCEFAWHLDVPYNMPKFCPMKSWNPHAETLVNDETLKDNFFNIFVNTNNTMYVTIVTDGLYRMNLDGERKLTTIENNIQSLISVFATTNNDINMCCTYNKSGTPSGNQVLPDETKCKCTVFIFVCWRRSCETNSQPPPQSETITINIFKWNSITNITRSITNVTEFCFSLFVDKKGTIYCSLTFNHNIIQILVQNNNGQASVIAGTNNSGSASYMLSYPYGIFVTDAFDLYVADAGNDRIQLFRQGNRTGKTITTNNSLETIKLSLPTGVVLDADGFLFIVDSGNHRIIGSGPNGFRCLVGCSRRNGSADNLLSNPRTMSFDSYGNMIVTDHNNYRIQKFRLATNSCGKCE